MLVSRSIVKKFPVAVQSKPWVCGLLIAGIAGSIQVPGMNSRLLRLLRVVKVSGTPWSFVQRSPAGCECLMLCDWETRRPRPELVGRDSVVGIETRYGMDGLGIESRCWRYFRHTSRNSQWPTQPPVQSVRFCFLRYSGRKVAFPTDLHLGPGLKKK
jgi:hypothetical protein